MKAVIQIIRILVVIQLIENIRCQSFGEGDIFRYFSLGNSEDEVEPVTGYSANVLSHDANNQALASLNLQQYQVTEDFEQPDEYSRADFARTKKLFRIKNPFQHQSENVQQADNNSDQHDNSQGASNQYVSVQYSMPPDDFLQKMKAENQFYQQQLSTPPPNTGYAATPLPQYQFSTISTSTYDNNNQQSNQMQLDSKVPQTQNFFSNANNYQYSTPNTFSVENVQSTPSPYSPTPLPNNNQFVGTASNPYVSSSIPLFLSSPQNMQSYISSPYSQTAIQSSSSDYNNNRGSSTISSSSESYAKNDGNKRIQVEYYDNSVNGVNYPLQQYQSEYQPTTPTPTPSPYNTGINALSKSLQEISLSQFQNFAYPNSAQDLKTDGSADNFNSDTHRTSNFPASNVYFNYIQQDYPNQNNQKTHSQEGGQETGQTEKFSSGDFGWKLGGTKFTQNIDPNSNDQSIKTYHPSQSGNEAISQFSFHMDTGKHYNYNPISKATSENTGAQEFIKAVGKSQERSQQPQQYRDANYNFYNNNNQQPQSAALTSHRLQDNSDNQRNIYNENHNVFSFGNSQPDLVTASPIYSFNSREVNNERSNSLFDHAKALKAIVPIDVSNVVGNSEFQGKNGFEGSNRFNIFNFNREQSDQNVKQYNRPIADAYYKDKNAIYGFNIKTKPEDFAVSDNIKQYDQNTPLFSKQQQTLDLSQNIPINFASVTPSFSYNSQQETQQSHSNQQGVHRFHNQAPPNLDVFKVTDGPYRFTQGISNDNYKPNTNNFEQSGITTPLSGRINQNLNSHHLDVSSGSLNKFVTNKSPGISFGKPDSEGFSGVLPTINGFRVANPFNVDMKLVADVLKGRPTVDESHLLPFRDQFNKASPPRLDLAQLQLLLKNENIGNLASYNDGGSSLTSSYFEPYNGRLPYQGIKYSRSQEEEENIPITDSDTANNPFIGAVIDQDDTQNESEIINEPAESTAEDEESITSVNLVEEKPKKVNPPKSVGERQRHPNAIGPGRHPFQRKYPRTNGPYPFFKPPPFNKSRNKITHSKNESMNRKRRLNKPPPLRILMTAEPMYEAGSFSGIDNTPLPILLRPPPQVAEAKSD
ncbi:hypothetical protein K1T71_008358 [Dendrolimus kikuchii]|uniref:Uncharacterized protein n=1 Tax=Dendrolimus kikuchii TaxID=765133 RepID=A0ACC1CXF7_9NEOP|nr:hypothetical protein K1T71_008358 [Dendrolimus kikuchii]